MSLQCSTLVGVHGNGSEQQQRTLASGWTWLPARYAYRHGYTTHVAVNLQLSGRELGHELREIHFRTRDSNYSCINITSIQWSYWGFKVTIGEAKCLFLWTNIQKRTELTDYNGLLKDTRLSETQWTTWKRYHCTTALSRWKTLPSAVWYNDRQRTFSISTTNSNITL